MLTETIRYVIVSQSASGELCYDDSKLCFRSKQVHPRVVGIPTHFLFRIRNRPIRPSKNFRITIEESRHKLNTGWYIGQWFISKCRRVSYFASKWSGNVGEARRMLYHSSQQNLIRNARPGIKHAVSCHKVRRVEWKLSSAKERTFSQHCLCGKFQRHLFNECKLA